MMRSWWLRSSARSAVASHHDDIDALKSLLADQAIKLDHFVARNEQLQTDKIVLKNSVYEANKKILAPQTK